MLCTVCGFCWCLGFIHVSTHNPLYRFCWIVCLMCLLIVSGDNVGIVAYGAVDIMLMLFVVVWG